MKEPDRTALFTAQEAAAILGCCRSFLTKHAAELGAVKVGTRLRFRQANLDAYIARQTVTAPEQAAPAPRQQPTDIRAHRSPVGKVTGRQYAPSPTTTTVARAGEGRS